MGKKILVQSGHYNVENNCNTTFRPQTGAPKEQARNYAIATKLIDLLNKNGFDAHFTDSNINCPSNAVDANKDWDLFLALHCDSDYQGVEGGGFVDYPDPSVDSSNAESKRIKEAIEAEYFKNTGIRNVPTRSNPNTKFYYAWQYLTAKTPCVIIEMGESIDPHDSVILNDINMVANAILKGIIRAFGVQVAPIPTPTPQPAPDYKKQLEDLQKEYLIYKNGVTEQAKQIQEAITKERADWQTKVTQAKKDGANEMKLKIINLIQSLSV